MWHFETKKDETSARKWYDETPAVLKTSAEFGIEGLNYLGSVNGEPKAIVNGEWRDEDTVEGHLFCAKDADIDFLTAMVGFAKTETLKQVLKIVTIIPTRHKLLHEIMRRTGFQDTGLFTWRSVYKGRLLEQKIYVAVKV